MDRLDSDFRLLDSCITIGVTVWVEFYEVVNEVRVLNSEGDKGTAPIVYKKGLRDFQPNVTFSFAEGLASNGWRVEMTSVNIHAPTDVSGYNLLVLRWPVYWFSPSPPIRRYLRRIGDLEGKRTVIICTAADAPAGNCEKTKSIVQAAKGEEVKSLTLFKIRPNESDMDPLEIANRVGR